MLALDETAVGDSTVERYLKLVTIFFKTPSGSCGLFPFIEVSRLVSRATTIMDKFSCEYPLLEANPDTRA